MQKIEEGSDAKRENPEMSTTHHIQPSDGRPEFGGVPIVCDTVEVHVVRGHYDLLELVTTPVPLGPGTKEWAEHEKLCEMFAVAGITPSPPTSDGLVVPILGRIEEHENACGAALRALREQTGLSPESTHFGGMWSLATPNVLFAPGANRVAISPRFVVQIARTGRGAEQWEPHLSERHSSRQWNSIHWEIYRSRVDAYDHVNYWPGVRALVTDLMATGLPNRGQSKQPFLAVDG